MGESSGELACPLCGSEYLRRSQIRTVDRLYRLLGYEPFRCFDCGERSRLKSPAEQFPGMSFPASEPQGAQCPNCRRETEIRLTPAEREMAGSEGWLISCPGCKALFPLVRPAGTPSAAG